jgi:hypothetical protein
VDAEAPNGALTVLAKHEGPGTLRVPPAPGALRDVVTWTSTHGGRWFGATVTTATGSRTATLWAARIFPLAVYTHYEGFLQSANDWMQRIAMASDAVQLWIQRPWRGWGAGGWAVAYPRVESYGYYSTQVHNSVLQVAVEAGVFGIVALALLLWGVWQGWRRGRDPAADALLAVVAIIAVHSLMDWDLSLPAVLWAWALLAGAAVGGGAAVRDAHGHARPWLAFMGVAGGLAGVLAVGQFTLAAANTTLTQHRALQALPLYQTAFRWDPLSAQAVYGVAQIETQLIPVNGAQAGPATAAFGRLHQLSGADYVYQAETGVFDAHLGHLHAALTAEQEAVRAAPYRVSVYQYAVGTAEWVGYTALAAHDDALAHQAFTDALKDARRMAQVSAHQPAATPSQDWLPTTSPDVQVFAGLAAVGLHQPATAAHWLPSFTTPVPHQDLTALALGTTAAAWEAQHPQWSRFVRRFAARLPGFRQQWGVLRGLLASSAHA